MARPKLNFQIGLDLGNGNIKVVADDFQERIPSYIDACGASDAVGCVQYDNKSFCVGYGASQSQTGLPTSGDKAAKIDSIEKLYLGALAHLKDLPAKMKTQIVVSSHAWESHKEVIKNNLEKQQSVILSGQVVDLTTEVLAVVPEGFGSIINHPKKAKIATLDFGTGTVLLTPYANGKPMETKTSNEGVQKLIFMIAERMKAINNGYPGDANEIRRCLEAGKLVTKDKCDFKSVYKLVLPQWWDIYLKDLGNEANYLLGNGYHILAIGGGVALPGFSSVLEKKGFECVKNRPEMVSAQGLYQMAVKKCTVNAATKGESK